MGSQLQRGKSAQLSSVKLGYASYGDAMVRSSESGGGTPLRDGLAAGKAAVP